MTKHMRIAPCGAILLHYDFKVEYKPRDQIKVSDALSRLPLNDLIITPSKS